MSKYLNQLNAVTTPVGADFIPVEQLASPNELKRITFTNLMAYFTGDISDKLEMLAYVGGFMPLAGTVTYAYDGSDRVSTITYATSPVGVVTYNYNGDGTINYVQGVFTSPVAITIRNTFAYVGGKISTVTRTVS